MQVSPFLHTQEEKVLCTCKKERNALDEETKDMYMTSEKKITRFEKCKMHVLKNAKCNGWHC